MTVSRIRFALIDKQWYAATNYGFIALVLRPAVLRTAIASLARRETVVVTDQTIL